MLQCQLRHLVGTDSSTDNPPMKLSTEYIQTNAARTGRRRPSILVISAFWRFLAQNNYPYSVPSTYYVLLTGRSRLDCHLPDLPVFKYADIIGCSIAIGMDRSVTRHSGGCASSCAALPRLSFLFGWMMRCDGCMDVLTWNLTAFCLSCRGPPICWWGEVLLDMLEYIWDIFRLLCRIECRDEYASCEVCLHSGSLS